MLWEFLRSDATCCYTWKFLPSMEGRIHEWGMQQKIQSLAYHSLAAQCRQSALCVHTRNTKTSPLRWLLTTVVQRFRNWSLRLVSVFHNQDLFAKRTFADVIRSVYLNRDDHTDACSQREEDGMALDMYLRGSILLHEYVHVSFPC